MKKTKKVSSIVICLALLLSVIPIHAIADTTMTFNFTAGEDSGVTLSTEDQRHIIVTKGEQNDWVDIVRENEENAEDVTVSCSSDTYCTIVVKNESAGIKFRYNRDAFSFNYGTGNAVYNGEILTSSENFFVTRSNSFFQFDGKAYLIWSCGNGTCYHYFNDINVNNNGDFRKASTIEADNKAGTYFDVHAEYKAFSFPSDFENWQNAYKAFKGISTIDFSKVPAKDVIGNHVDMREYEEASGCKPENYPNEDDFHACVDEYVAGLGLFTASAEVRPTSEPFLENAYVSYGDRAFKVIVYNDDFKGISIGTLKGLNYYTHLDADELLRQNAFDISGTTKSNPVDISMVLLESKINLEVLDYNGFAVKSMEAIDVPSGAVTVTKNSNGTFTLEFSSNFYDRVVFKVTDTSNNPYYIRIVRESIYADSIDVARGRGISVSYFYFDRTTSWTDYTLTATINYKDGTTKIVELQNAKFIDDGLFNVSEKEEEDLENPSRSEWALGKGLKVASFKYDLSQDEVDKIDNVYVNAEYKGSTNSNYAGAYSGSGKGVELRIERGQ